jgi:hypothetical protein
MDRIRINGKEYRVEANWRALTGYLKERGTDSLEAVADVINLSPSNIGGLMAACINEGERLEGREVHLTADVLDEMRPAEAIQTAREFIGIYLSQVAPALPEEPKKDEAR